MKKLFLQAIAAAAILSAGQASAAELVLNSGASNVGGGKEFTASDGTKVRVTAWSIDHSETIRRANLGLWSEGLGADNGISSGGDNSHTVDNSGWEDFLVFQFDKIVSLSNADFRTGWHGANDTDATIGFANFGTPIGTNLSLLNQNRSILDQFGLYESTAPNGNNVRGINGLGNAGNTWLIGTSFVNRDGKNDGFKLRALSFDQVQAVPEPTTWLMMLLGFGFVGSTLRHGKNRKTRTSVTYA